MRNIFLQISVIVLILLSSALAKAQNVAKSKSNGTITGIIISETHESLARISLQLKEIQLGTITDKNGEFEIKDIPAGNYTFIASGIGYAASKQNVMVVSGQTTVLNLQLNKVTQSLSEVIINGKSNQFAKRESVFISKMPLSNLENPQVYNSISKELITEQLLFSVDDAIRNSPGIQKMWEATGRVGDGGSYYNTRGFITQSMLRNGLAGKVTSAIDAINLENLEVIKGPSATLFGSSLTSYGGAINRVTKKPLEKYSTEIAIAGGSDDFHRVSADMNVPLTENKDLLFRLNTAYNYEGSFQERGFNKSFALAPSLLFKANDKLTINLDAELFTAKSTGKQMYFFYFPSSDLGIYSAEEFPMDYSYSYTGNGLSQKSRSSNFFGQVSYRFSENFSSSTNITTSHSFSDGFGSYFYLTPDNVVTEDPLDAGKSNYITRADQSTQDSKDRAFEVQQYFNASFNLGKLKNRIVFGLDFYSTNANQIFFGSVYDIAPANDPNFNYSYFNKAQLDAKYQAGEIDFNYPIVNKVETYSAFLSDVLNITDNFSVLAALRTDRYNNKGGTEGEVYEGYKQTAFSPKFGMVYQPVKDKVALFVNYQNSFSNQGVYTLYDSNEPDSLRQKIADLEQANQIEGGVKLDIWKGRLSATVSYYNILVDNMLRTDPNPEGAMRFAKIQDGTQRSKGVEFDIIANPYQGLNIIAGFSYNDSKFEQSDLDVLGRRPTTASSPYLANIWISYHFPKNVIKGLGIGLGGNYASDNKIMNSVYNGEFILPAYTIINASAFYDYRKFRLGFKMDNITNQRYWIGYTTANPQKLRTMVASLTYKF